MKEVLIMILGLHHVSMKTQNNTEYAAVLAFYRDLLHLPVLMESDACTLLDTGSGLVEIFRNGTSAMPQGVIRHFALRVDDTDAMIEAVRTAGYRIHMEPKDVQVGGNPAFPARVGFCIGPLGEQVEFFCQKW